MNKLPTKMLAVVLVISTAVSSMASVSLMIAPPLPLSAPAAPLTAPTVLAKKQALNSAEFEKYQQLADQSQDLATRQTAGASSTMKTVLITSAVVVVTVIVIGLAVGNSGPNYPLSGF